MCRKQKDKAKSAKKLTKTQGIMDNKENRVLGAFSLPLLTPERCYSNFSS